MNRRTATVFVDALFVLVLLLVLLPHKPHDASETSDPSHGAVLVEMRWPDAADTDVDVWVKAPGDRAVGYSRARGRVFSLLRDDLGQDGQVPIRTEHAYARAAPEGAYQVNVHAFSDRGRHLPFNVQVTVYVRDRGVLKRVLRRSILLSAAGEEVTVFHWTMHQGAVAAGSVHYTPAPLRERGAM